MPVITIISPDVMVFAHEFSLDFHRDDFSHAPHGCLTAYSVGSVAVGIASVLVITLRCGM